MQHPTPESVKYHPEARHCSLCEYFAAGDRCLLLAIRVKPEGGCNRFEPRKKTTLRGMAERA
jgi:hypothetical protein